MIAKCPKCQKTLNKVGVDQTSIEDFNYPKYYMLIFKCRSCHTAIGAQIDPQVQAQIIKEQFDKKR